MADSAEAFIAWAREHAVALKPDADLDDFSDLMPLKDIIGAARLVGHDENHHYPVARTITLLLRSESTRTAGRGRTPRVPNARARVPV